MKKKFKILALANIVFVNFILGKTINVPSEYPKIQSAISASANGDTILVQPGTYVENINFSGKSVVLGSLFIKNGDKEYIKKTIIDGGSPVDTDYGSTVKILSGESPVIAGFTITKGIGTIMSGGGWMEGGGIVIDNGSSPVIRNNIIINNTNLERKGINARGGGGISSMSSNPTIINNIIMSNTSAYAGGVVLNWSGGTIKNNVIYNNTATGSNGSGGVMIWDKPSNSGAHQLVCNNLIIGNYSHSITGGMSIDGTANPDVRNNIIWGNRQAAGNQIVLNSLGQHFYSDIENNDNSNNCINVYPDFAIDTMFMLNSTSLCIDAGDTAVKFSDLKNPSDETKAKSPSNGALRNDMGAFGGPGASNLPVMKLEKILYTNMNLGNLKPGKEITRQIEILNLGTGKIKIDSLIITHHSKNLLLEDASAKELLPMQFINAKLKLKPVDTIINDTLFVFHNLKNTANPIKINITGESSLKKNLASWGKATASSDQGSNYNPGYAIDNSPGTRWQSVASNNQWLKIELDTVYVLGKVIIDWETAYGKKYRIQTSLDGEHWKNVYYEGNSDGGQDVLLFSPDTAKYVRLDAIQLGTDWGFSTYEFKVYITDGKKYPVHTEIKNQIKEHSTISNYPNPFKYYTTFEYQVEMPGKVVITVFNLSGRVIETLVDEYKQQGTYSLEWMPKEATPGFYLYRMNCGNKQLNGNLLILR